MIDRIISKFKRTFFPPRAFRIPSGVTVGKSVGIDLSALLMPSKNGRIVFEGENYVGRQVEIGTEGLVEIGEGTTIQDRCIILGDVSIGRYCTFAPNVYISSGRHYYDHKPQLYIRDQDALVHGDPELSKEHSRKVTIGDDVWLGINCVIMSGIKIGRGAVVGSNSVVTKDVEPYTVVAGMPAKLIRNRINAADKAMIRFDRDEDLPNFYSGIFVNMKNVNESRSKGGLYAGNAFTLYGMRSGNRIRLKMKSNSKAALRIQYGKQNAEITSEFCDILFDAASDQFHSFRISPFTDRLEKLALISEVEILSN
jgi:acetyltransferase-like isoleucine patch superfamily enzyme